MNFDKIRFEHFDTLNIDVKGKNILELGSGTGIHTKFLYHKSPSKIISIESNSDNFNVLKDKFKNAKKVVPINIDIENNLTSIEEIKEGINLIYNYGLLHNLINPFRFIDVINKIPHEMMIIETCIELDGDSNAPNIYKLIDKLKENYKTVVYPKQPEHDFYDVHSVPAPESKRIVIICKDQILDKAVKIDKQIAIGKNGNKSMLDRFNDIMEPLQQPIIMEFGAFEGYYSRVMLDVLQHTNKKYNFHLFEPNPDLMPIIVDKLSYYLVSNGTHVRFFCEAIGGNKGKNKFFKNNDGLSSIKKPKYDSDVSFFETTTDVVTLDYHMQRVGMQGLNIDLIWADIQGAEIDLINGGQETLKNNVRYLCLGYGNPENIRYEGEIYLSEILEILPEFEIIEDYNGTVLLKNKNLA